MSHRSRANTARLDSMLRMQPNPHKNEKGLCSFAALVDERFSGDAVLMEMARIVQAADFKNQLDDHPAARGLQLISQGFPFVTNDDHETAAHAAFVYDSLYASIESSKTKSRRGQ